MQQKLITFAVPCYNSAAYMRHCIETLLSAGEQAEIILVDEMASTLGMALASIAATTDPEMFMIGGGVARAGEILFNPLVRHYKEYAFQSCKETPIKAASLGNDAGIYGAVRLIVGA